jgi:hypothetical protein
MHDGYVCMIVDVCVSVCMYVYRYIANTRYVTVPRQPRHMHIITCIHTHYTSLDVEVKETKYKSKKKEPSNISNGPNRRIKSPIM